MTDLDQPRTSISLFDSPVRSTVDVEHICDFEIEFADPLQVIAGPGGGLRVTVVVASGEARGPRLNGEFLPGGGDWLTIGPDNIAHLDVRATIRADDGHLIHMTNTGRAIGDPASAQRFFAGDLLAWDTHYIRSSPLFETDSERYAWLNGAVTTAVNEVAADRVHYRVYHVR